MNKKRKLFVEDQIRIIKNRMKNGCTMFGDKKRLKDFQAELAGQITTGKDW